MAFTDVFRFVHSYGALATEFYFCRSFDQLLGAAYTGKRLDTIT